MSAPPLEKEPIDPSIQGHKKVKLYLHLDLSLGCCDFLVMIIVYTIKINASMQCLLFLEMLKVVDIEHELNQMAWNQESVNLVCNFVIFGIKHGYIMLDGYF